METILLWIICAAVNFALVLICYRFFGKMGLFAWISMATVLANIQVLKTIDLLGFTVTLGNVIYGTTFFIVAILNEKYGRKDALQAVYLGFFILLTATILMQISLAFRPSSADFAHPHLQAIFGLMPRLAIASLIGYLISHSFNVWSYQKLIKRFPSDRHLWIRNGASTMISQLFDSFIFCTIAFTGLYSFSDWMEIFLSTYMIKWFVAVCDTPFIYVAKRLQPPKYEAQA